MYGISVIVLETIQCQFDSCIKWLSPWKICREKKNVTKTAEDYSEARCQKNSSLDFYCRKLQKEFVVQSGLLSKWDEGSPGDLDILYLFWENGIQFIVPARACLFPSVFSFLTRFKSLEALSRTKYISGLLPYVHEGQVISYSNCIHTVTALKRNSRVSQFTLIQSLPADYCTGMGVVSHTHTKTWTPSGMDFLSL